MVVLFVALLLLMLMFVASNAAKAHGSVNFSLVVVVLTSELGSLLLGSGPIHSI